MRRRPRKIVGLGLAVVDHLYVVDRIDLAGVRTRYFERVVATGGMVATALLQAARLGCPAHLLSWIGDDPEGRLVRARMRAAGVDTSRLLLSPRAHTTLAIVLVERATGERRFLVADRRALERAAPDFDLRVIDREAVLLVDGHFPRQALRAARRAREVGATVVADLSRPRREHLALLPYVDHAVVSQEFADAWTHGNAREALERLAALTRGEPVVTQGARGGTYLFEGRVRRFRATQMRVRDTTGAGDVFHGAFAAGLAHGLPLPDAIACAARAAALCCTALGGPTRLLAREEFLRRWPAVRAGASRAGRSRARARRRPA